MDQSVGSTIEKIKVQEQDMEAKLKEKREYEATLSSLNRAIRDAISQAQKSDQEQFEITKKIEKLRPMIEIEKIKRDTLLSQIKIFSSMLKDLRAQCDRGVTNVWSIRTSLCETVQNVSNECDIWALLTRPVCMESSPSIVNKNVEKDEVVINEDRLQAAVLRREKARAEHQRLLVEPETGEEFIRKVIF